MIHHIAHKFQVTMTDGTTTVLLAYVYEHTLRVRMGELEEQGYRMIRFE